VCLLDICSMFSLHYRVLSLYHYNIASAVVIRGDTMSPTRQAASSRKSTRRRGTQRPWLQHTTNETTTIIIITHKHLLDVTTKAIRYHCMCLTRTSVEPNIGQPADTEQSIAACVNESICHIICNK